MSTSQELTETIEDSITDVEIPDTLEADDLGEDTTDTPSEASEAPTNDSVPEVKAESQVQPPTAQTAPKPVDDFDKKFGLTAQSSSGRENRIPYTRVKKITEKAVKDAKDAWSKEVETGYVPSAKYQETEAKVKDYEGRLTQVAEFERIMTEEPVKFLKMLVGLPQYAEIFNSPSGKSETQPQAQPQPPVDPHADMPQPDQQLSDGSYVYSMDGLKSLMSWQANQVEQRVTKQVEQRYAPLENDYKQYQQVQAVIPQVQQQIAEAKTWPLFNESEDEVVKALQRNPSWSLERAYQAVVLPKLQSERDRVASEGKVNREAMRAEILREIKQAPRATSAGASGVKASPEGSKNQSVEDIIAESIKGLK